MLSRKYDDAGINKKAVMLTDYFVLRRYQRGHKNP